MINRTIEFLKENCSYYLPLNIKVGLKILENRLDLLKGYANSYSYKVGEQLKDEDVQEQDDLCRAGRPDLQAYQDLMDLNKLPTTKKEHFQMKKSKKKLKDLGKFIEDHKMPNFEAKINLCEILTEHPAGASGELSRG